MKSASVGPEPTSHSRFSRCWSSIVASRLNASIALATTAASGAPLPKTAFTRFWNVSGMQASLPQCALPQFCQRMMSARVRASSGHKVLGVLLARYCMIASNWEQHEIAVDEGRGTPRGIEREILRHLVLALASDRKVLVVEPRNAEVSGDGPHLPGPRRNA